MRKRNDGTLVNRRNELIECVTILLIVALIIKEPITTLHLTLLLHSVIVPVSFSSILLLHLWTATIGQIIERMESCMLMSF